MLFWIDLPRKSQIHRKKISIANKSAWTHASKLNDDVKEPE